MTTTATSVQANHAGGALPARAAAAWSQVLAFPLQLVELSLLVLLIREFEIEGPGFFRLAVLATVGFAIHHHLPLAYRLPFFCALSLGALLLVLGVDGAWIVLAGAVLIGACHLPIAMRHRVLAVVALGALLAAMRARWLPAPWPDAVWPILGSIFMFRLIVYLYELAHAPAKPTPWQTLAYFFMLPNPCFPLFPVVDFATFKRCHYDGDASHIYQVGLRWMFRGLYQLIAYRLVYEHLALRASDVRDAATLVQYMLALFLLYLRVSGQFHVIVGMLHLFGFNLPETHHAYFLSSSFTDFWRRINIYWKDFMMKHFYYPVYFRMRQKGPTLALVAATAVVFLATWLLHSYQWFWLLGGFPITGPDAVFWGVLLVLVVVSSLYELRHGRARSLTRRTRTAREAALLALKTAATFCALCVLWSLWSSESLAEWLSVVCAPFAQDGSSAPAPGRGWLAALLVPALAITAALAPAAGSTSRVGTAAAVRPRALARLLPIALLLALARPELASAVHEDLGPLVASIKTPQLNARDAELLERGYYENLLGAQRFTSEVWRVAGAPAEEAPVQRTGDFLFKALRPDVRVLHHGQLFTTNEFGMRDLSYPRRASPGTHRTALIGASHALGFGVADGENFESLVEQRLNRERPGRHRRYEILNFAVTAYSPLQSYAMFEQRALAFDPDLVVLVAHKGDGRRCAEHIARVSSNGIAIPYPEIAAIAARAGVEPGMSADEIERRLSPHGDRMRAWVYRRLVADCRRSGCKAVALYVPAVEELERPARDESVRRPFGEAGLPLIDMKDVYLRAYRSTGLRSEQLWISAHDRHPNAAGHRLLAERLYRELVTRSAELDL